MADRHYTLTIKNVGGTGKKSPVSGIEQRSDGAVSGEDDKLGRAIANAVSYKQVQSLINQGIAYEVSQVEMRTGSAMLQEKASLGYSLANKLVNTSERVIGSALVTGGNPYAVLISIATSLLQEGLAYERRLTTLNTQRTLENESREQNIIRAGSNGSRRL